MLIVASIESPKELILPIFTKNSEERSDYHSQALFSLSLESRVFSLHSDQRLVLHRNKYSKLFHVSIRFFSYPRGLVVFFFVGLCLTASCDIQTFGRPDPTFCDIRKLLLQFL